MAQGKIRKGETDRVPLENPIWYVLLTVKNNEINEEIFHNTVSGKEVLIERIQKIQNSPEVHKLYAVWTGNWNTDLFDMDKNILLIRLIKNLEQRY